MSSLSQVVASAGIALLSAATFAAPAQAFAVWQGTAIIDSATGTGCADSGIRSGTTFRVFFKPANVGGNSSGSELMFVYELGAHTMHRFGDLSGSGTYDGDAVSFTLHNAGSFVFNFHRSNASQPFDITLIPDTVGTATQTIKLSGSVGGFFVLQTGSTSDCDVTFRANLLQQP